MVTILSLWMPIVLSAVAVFVVSSLIHMVMSYHQTDFKGLPDEARAMDALRPLAIPPGEYIMPFAKSNQERKSPEFLAKVKQGPIAFLNVLPGGSFGMGPALAQWFGYTLVIGVVVAYLLSRFLSPGTGYLEVFRLAGTVAFAAYAMALWQNSIWYKRSWSTTVKSTFDGLVYALVTAGIFGWRWPA